MMVAQIYHIPTINGMTFWVPIGWNLYDAAKGHVTEEALAGHTRVDSRRGCVLSMWTLVCGQRRLEPSRPEPEPVMAVADIV